MPSPLRVAVLETDTPLDKIKALYGGYGEIFERLLKAAADSLGQPDLISKDHIEITKYHVVPDTPEKQELRYPNIDDIDAVLITGSRTSTSRSRR